MPRVFAPARWGEVGDTTVRPSGACPASAVTPPAAPAGAPPPPRTAECQRAARCAAPLTPSFRRRRGCPRRAVRGATASMHRLRRVTVLRRLRLYRKRHDQPDHRGRELYQHRPTLLAVSAQRRGRGGVPAGQPGTHRPADSADENQSCRRCPRDWAPAPTQLWPRIRPLGTDETAVRSRVQGSGWSTGRE